MIFVYLFFQPKGRLDMKNKIRVIAIGMLILSSSSLAAYAVLERIDTTAPEESLDQLIQDSMCKGRN